MAYLCGGNLHKRYRDQVYVVYCINIHDKIMVFEVVVRISDMVIE